MTTATCTECGTSFRAARSTAAYCSSACRQRAYRDRNRTVTLQEKVSTRNVTPRVALVTTQERVDASTAVLALLADPGKAISDLPDDLAAAATSLIEGTLWEDDEAPWVRGPLHHLGEIAEELLSLADTSPRYRSKATELAEQVETAREALRLIETRAFVEGVRLAWGVTADVGPGS